MNTKKWTRTKGAEPGRSGGFTLIELIVVIAILAILAVVAVPAYSGYIERTNQAADETLIADIAHALELGAYSNNMVPKDLITVGLIKDGEEGEAWVEALGSVDAETANAIMEATFGPSWKSMLRLKSDAYANSNNALILQAILAARKADGSSIFDAIPNSSFYAQAGNSETLMQNVDSIATALNGVLDGLGPVAFSHFWGDDFHTSVENGGLKETWNKNDQMAANLTVFAVANQVMDADDARKNSWVSSWTGSTVDVNSSAKGYVADIAMQYAQCVAMYNYIINNSTDQRQINSTKLRYSTLENAMIALKNPQNGYVDDFNAAIDSFWSGLESERAAWQSSGQAATDAEAFLASMTALNTLEGSYVNQDKADILSMSNAFTEMDAASTVDTMVGLAKMGDKLKSGATVVYLEVQADGTFKIEKPEPME